MHYFLFFFIPLLVPHLIDAAASSSQNHPITTTVIDQQLHRRKPAVDKESVPKKIDIVYVDEAPHRSKNASHQGSSLFRWFIGLPLIRDCWPAPNRDDQYDDDLYQDFDENVQQRQNYASLSSHYDPPYTGAIESTQLLESAQQPTAQLSTPADQVLLFFEQASSSSQAASSSAIDQPKKPTSLFYMQTAKVEQRLEDLVHPLMHECGEPEPKKIFELLRGKIYLLFHHLVTGSFQEFGIELKRTMDTSGITTAAEMAALGAVGYYNPAGSAVKSTIIEKMFKILPTYPEEKKDARGNASHRFIKHIDADEAIQFPTWKPDVMCPGGLHKCPKIGHHSIELLSAIKSFIANINGYEATFGRDFFSPDDVNRVMSLLVGSIARMCEINIKSALAHQACDDKEVLPSLQLMNSLTAIPTQAHDILAAWEKNSARIDKLLSGLPEKEQREIFDFMNALADQIHNPNGAKHLVFAGPSGAGKTYIAYRILEALGFPLMTCSLNELLASSAPAPVASLIAKGKLSSLEHKILRLQLDNPTRGISALHPVFFVDEVDEDRKFVVSDLKDKFDQFKRLSLSKLGITLPVFFNCIFTTNNTSLLRDPALVGRFIQVNLPAMSMEKKIEILLEEFDAMIAREPLLSGYDAEYRKDLIVSYALYDDDMNPRILISNLANIISYLKQREYVQSALAFRLAPAMRSGNVETFDEFLERKFGKKVDAASSSYKQSKRGKLGKRPAVRSRSSSDDGLQEDSTSGDY